MKCTKKVYELLGRHVKVYVSGEVEYLKATVPSALPERWPGRGSKFANYLRSGILQVHSMLSPEEMNLWRCFPLLDCEVVTAQTGQIRRFQSHVFLQTQVFR